MKNEQGRLHSAPATTTHRSENSTTNGGLTRLQRALEVCGELDERELEAALDILAVRYARTFLLRRLRVVDDPRRAAA
jgi:hypothetical protein